MNEDKIHQNYDKNALFRPPPWFVGHNVIPPTIPSKYRPMRIIEKDNPREPLGHLIATDDLREILINYYYQRGFSTMEQITAEINKLPQDKEKARAYLYEATQNYLAALIAPLDDLCHSQQPFLNCDQEKDHLCRIIDQLRWRQGFNLLRRECRHKIAQKRQMIEMLREIRARAQENQKELIVRQFPPKYCPEESQE